MFSLYYERGAPAGGEAGIATGVSPWTDDLNPTPRSPRRGRSLVGNSVKKMLSAILAYPGLAPGAIVTSPPAGAASLAGGADYDYDHDNDNDNDLICEICGRIGFRRLGVLA